MRGLDEKSWRPILEGALADAAWRAIHDIAGELVARAEAGPTEEGLNPSLAAGDAGQALLFAYLARAQPGRGHDDRAVWFLDRAFDCIATQPIGPGLYGGYAGAAWVAEHLRGAVGLLDAGEDTNEDVDAALADVLAAPPGDSFDLVGGLVGIGAYALERLPHGRSRHILERVVVHLAATAERDARGAVWITHRDDEPGPVVDLGVAHGVAGVIALLGEACRVGVGYNVARPLLDAAVAGLRARALPPGGTSRYAAIIPVHAMEPPPPTRSAWCYGDPGVAAALLVAARATEDLEWEEEACALARVAATRPQREAGVVDAGMCHGAAGLAHVLLRLYRATGDPACRDAACYWLGHTLDMRHPGEGIAGYRAWHPERDWTDDPTLLTGAAGVALILLGAVAPVAPDWDRMLLTTIAPIRHP